MEGNKNTYYLKQHSNCSEFEDFQSVVINTHLPLVVGELRMWCILWVNRS